MDNKRFKDALDSPDISREFFLPLNLAFWQGDRYTLGDGDPGLAGTQIAGVRLLERDHLNPDTIKDCQRDMTSLVQSLIHLREKTPELAGVVLSPEFVPAPHAGLIGGKRLKFGLACPENTYLEDSAAAGECHKQIDRAIRKSGFVVVQPKEFNPQTGMAGLLQWASLLELRRRKYPSPLWLLLLLLLLPLLCFLPWNCSSSPPFPRPEAEAFGVPVNSDSFIILFDKSESMEKCFPFAQKEAKRFLDARLKNSKRKCFGNIIYYDKEAKSELGGIEELTEKVRDKLGRGLDNLKPGGGTNLQSAIDMAAEEAKKHNQDTTLLIITDGEDKSIGKMLEDMDAVKKKFGTVKMVANSTSPRHFDPTNNPPVPNYLHWEDQLQKFSKALGGTFGPR